MQIMHDIRSLNLTLPTEWAIHNLKLKMQLSPEAVAVLPSKSCWRLFSEMGSKMDGAWSWRSSVAWGQFVETNFLISLEAAPQLWWFLGAPFVWCRWTGDSKSKAGDLEQGSSTVGNKAVWKYL